MNENHNLVYTRVHVARSVVLIEDKETEDSFL